MASPESQIVTRRWLPMKLGCGVKRQSKEGCSCSADKTRRAIIVLGIARSRETHVWEILGFCSFSSARHAMVSLGILFVGVTIFGCLILKHNRRFPTLLLTLAIYKRNLSSSGLSGNMSSSFVSLKGLQYLDLSHNNLTGAIPNSLSQLPSLTLLDLTGNQLSGSIPSGLLKRTQDGSLNLRYVNNPNLCTNGNSCQPAGRKSKIAVYIAVPVVLVVAIVLVAVLLFCLLRRKKQGSTNNCVKPQNETTSYVPTDNGYGDSSLRLENRRFTYKELETITNNFQRVLGRGGFGYVYDGILEDGTQVVVKLPSQSSNQGVSRRGSGFNPDNPELPWLR